MSRDVAVELAAAARRLAAQRLCQATSGNFSARWRSGALVSRSGADKSALGPDDFVVVDANGEVAPGAAFRASAETLLHLAIYASRPAHAVVHTHGVGAVVLSKRHVESGNLVLSGWEMLKALDGVSTHDHAESIPIFPNTQDMKSLAKDVTSRLAAEPSAHAFLIAGHGLTTWGATVADAVRHAEALEYLFDCVLAEPR